MRADGEWYLCTGVDRQKGIAYGRCGALMPRPIGFIRRHPSSHYWRGCIPLSDGQIEFYPTVSWREYRVEPTYWSHSSAEPLLMCRIFNAVEGGVGDASPAELVVQFETVARRLEGEGWVRDGRDGWHKLCHVDELEKEPGPPPETRV